MVEIEGYVTMGRVFGVRIYETPRFFQKKGTELLYQAMKAFNHKKVRVIIKEL